MPALSHELIIRPRLPEYLSYSSQKFQPISTSHPLLRLVCPPKRAYVSVLIARLRLPHPPPTDERVDAISYSFQTNRMSRTIRRYVDNRCTEISCPSYIFENILADAFFFLHAYYFEKRLTYVLGNKIQWNRRSFQRNIGISVWFGRWPIYLWVCGLSRNQCNFIVDLDKSCPLGRRTRYWPHQRIMQSHLYFPRIPRNLHSHDTFPLVDQRI